VLIHHIDRGSQYAAADDRKVLGAAGILQSMSWKGNCLRQCTDGNLLRHSENRTRVPGLLQNSGCCPARLVRHHRRILQSSAASFRPRQSAKPLHPVSPKSQDGHWKGDRESWTGTRWRTTQSLANWSPLIPPDTPCFPLFSPVLLKNRGYFSRFPGPFSVNVLLVFQLVRAMILLHGNRDYSFTYQGCV
jgi:hypothetical protein